MTTPTNFAEGRTLTDADIDALVAKFEERAMNNFYKNLGKGLWAMFQKAFITVVVLIAAYGAVKGFK
jgi:hypothetical protein